MSEGQTHEHKKQQDTAQNTGSTHWKATGKGWVEQ